MTGPVLLWKDRILCGSRTIYASCSKVQPRIAAVSAGRQPRSWIRRNRVLCRKPQRRLGSSAETQCRQLLADSCRQQYAANVPRLLRSVCQVLARFSRNCIDFLLLRQTCCRTPGCLQASLRPGVASGRATFCCLPAIVKAGLDGHHSPVSAAVDCITKAHAVKYITTDAPQFKSDRCLIMAKAVHIFYL